MNKSLKIALLIIFGQYAHTSFAHVYLECHLGGMFGLSKISCLKTQNTYNIQDLTAFFDIPTKKLSPSVIGGFKIGWWPNHCQYTSDNSMHKAWWEYFGCYLDTCFNRLDYAHRICSADVCYSNSMAYATGKTDICMASNGPAATLAFLLACRYGFLATDTIPFGRLQTYLGFGPAGLFTHQKARLIVSPHEVDGSNLTVVLKNEYTIAPSKKDCASAPCLALDTGMRYIAANNIFLDCFFNYRFSPVRISYACTQQLSMKLRYHMFSFGMGVGYEF